MRAERKAGELLKRLERKRGARTELHSNVEESSPYRAVLDEYEIAEVTAHRLLLLAVIYRAVLDARAGDCDAREWLTVGEGREWAEALGLARWPPPLDKRAMMSGKRSGPRKCFQHSHGPDCPNRKERG